MTRGWTRRRVLIGTATVVGGGLVLSWLGDDAAERPLAGQPDVLEPNAYLQIMPSGEIILQVDKLEMGQGVMTGFVTLLAEELGVHPDRITPRHAPVHALFQNPSQVTAESRSMRSRWDKIRETGATAREMLMRAAAERWQVTTSDLRAPGDGTVINTASGDSLSYAELATAASRLRVPANVALKSPGDYRWIGAPVARPDTPAKVRGEAKFGIDTILPDMLVAVVARAPRLGGSLLGFDATEAERWPGVHAIVEIHSGIAVVAETFWHAGQAARKLQIDWGESPLAGATVADIHARQRELLATGSGPEPRDDGDVAAAFATASETLDAEYALPYLAHATMEPMNATVRLTDERCEIWVPTQAPDLTRQVACQMTGLRRDQVDVHTTFAGGGFGRRVLNDYVAEAVAIALQVQQPVKLIWSREDDIRHDYFRGANLHRIRAALDGTGRPTGWDHRLVTASLARHILPVGLATIAPEWVPDQVIETGAALGMKAMKRLFGPMQAYDGAATMPYDIANVRVGVVDYDPGVPVGICRSVGNHYNAFVVESFIDELAHQAGEDPLQYRRGLLTGRPRHLAVLDRLSTESDWRVVAPGRYQGLAIHECYDSVVGQVAEISIGGDSGIRLHRITCVVDCGIAINPDVVRGQMESGIIFGLTAAIHGEIDIEDGYVQQSNFHDYRMLRMFDTPAIDVHIIDSRESPGGVGEPGTPPIAPAMTNAIFAATGIRLRKLPIDLSGYSADAAE